MALGNSAEILLKIKADSKDAVSGINDVQGAAKGLESSVSGLQGPLLAAKAAIASVTAVAVGAAIGIFQLSKNTAEYGSTLLNLQKQLGLTAATLSTLQIAANQAGVSIEQVGDVVGELTQKLGEASAGDKKAQETLDAYGITSRNTQTALGQLVDVIQRQGDVERKTAIATAVLGDEGRKFLPVIAQLKGGLANATAEAERLGQTMSQKSLEDSKRFSEGLKGLQTQAAATGREFALELMPAITDAMATITAAMQANKGVAANWAKTLLNEIRSVSAGFQAFGEIAQIALSGSALGFVASSNASISWSSVVARSITSVIAPFYELIRVVGDARRELSWLMGGTDGSINSGPKIEGGNLKAGLGGSLEIPRGVGGGSRRGGGSRGGGTRGAAGASTSPYDLAKRSNQNTIELTRQAAAEGLAENERLYAEGLRVKEDYETTKVALARYALTEEIRLAQELLDTVVLTLEERAEAERELVLKESELREKDNESAAEAAKQKQKDYEDALDAGAEALAEFERLQYEAAEKEKKLAQETADKLQKIREEKQKKRLEEQKKDLDALIRLREEEESRSLTGMLQNAGGGLFGNIKDVFDDSGRKVSNGLGVMGSALQSLKSIGLDAFQSLASGFGQLVSNWVLYGDAGAGGLRKLTASILSNVAATATTYALMCLAAAALATTVFGGALMGGTPAQFLKAAALFGAVAIGTAVAGRAIAGDSFSNGSNGGGSTQNDPASQNNNFQSGQFGGFGNRLNNTLAAVEEGINTLTTKVRAMRPGDVLGMGVDENPNAVSDGLISGLQNNSRLTGALKRATGDAR